MKEKMNGKIRVVRMPVTERRNTYVRWDDYGGGDSELTGGEIGVRGYNGTGLTVVVKKDKKSGIKISDLKKSVEKGVVEWCKKYLPSATNWAGLYEPEWEIWFEINEGYAKPIMTKKIKEMIAEKASREFKL